jgi:hypothetical protein
MELNEIFVWKEYLNQEEIDIVKKENDLGNWVLSGKSDDVYSRMFWFKNLMNQKTLIEIFKNKVEYFLQKNIIVNRVYTNGQAHGQCGYFHQDQPDDIEGNFGSLVYYIHENYKPEWGGHLLVKKQDEIVSILPEFNSAVLFNSKWWHAPLEPTIHCKSQRESIAFKFQILD